MEVLYKITVSALMGEVKLTAVTQYHTNPDQVIPSLTDEVCWVGFEKLHGTAYDGSIEHQRLMRDIWCKVDIKGCANRDHMSPLYGIVERVANAREARGWHIKPTA